MIFKSRQTSSNRWMMGRKRTCAITDCNITASFGMPLDVSPTYCARHAKRGMFSLITRFCLVDKWCNMRPAFAIPGHDRVRAVCINHASPEMTRISHNICKLQLKVCVPPCKRPTLKKALECAEAQLAEAQRAESVLQAAPALEALFAAIEESSHGSQN